MNNKKSNIRSFEDLMVWKCARKIQQKVTKLVKGFPKEEKYRLTDQMIRSSRSVARNIAEGYGRYHYQENIQFCRQSRGSLSELKNDFYTAYEEDYVTKEMLNELKEHVEECNRLLNGYIRYLKKAKKEFKTQEPDLIYKVDPDKPITSN